MQHAQPALIRSALMRLPAVQAVTGDSRSKLYAKIAEGLMTKPLKISARAAAIPAREVEAINAARIRGASDDEIRALVARLHSERQRSAPATPEVAT